MSNYTIFTDSACDIRPEVLAEWGVPFCSLTFHFEGSPKEYSNYELSSGEFTAGCGPRALRGRRR